MTGNREGSHALLIIGTPLLGVLYVVGGPIGLGIGILTGLIFGLPLITIINQQEANIRELESRVDELEAEVEITETES